MSDIDPDVFLSEVFQLGDELSDLREAVSDKRRTTIILDALSENIYPTIKMQSIRDPGLGLGEIISIKKMIFINHSKRSSVPKRSHESYRKSRDNSGRDPIMNGRELAMASVFTCHNCKRPGHKNRDCNRLNKKSDESSNMGNITMKWCSNP